MDGVVGVRHKERLSVGVDRYELDTLDACLDHTVDGIGAAATDANDLDDGQVFPAYEIRHSLSSIGSCYSAPHCACCREDAEKIFKIE
jgi:hypothetical protein